MEQNSKTFDFKSLARKSCFSHLKEVQLPNVELNIKNVELYIICTRE
jgi:hypothetical protein